MYTEFNYDNSLYHHGIKGQRWGIRRYQNEDGGLTAAGKERYNTAKTEYKNAKKDLRYKSGIGIGMKSLQKYSANRDHVRKKEIDMIDAKADYKKLKAKTAEKAEKAEFKAYKNEMRKTGLPGSANDDRSHGRSTDLYNHISKKKGKNYADRVAKSVEKDAVIALAASGTLFVASMGLEFYNAYKYY